LAAEHGQQRVIELAMGVADEGDRSEASRIQEYYKVCLGTADLSGEPLENLV